MNKRFRKLIAGKSQNPDIAHRQYLLNIILLGLAGSGFIFGIVMLILWLLDLSPPTGAIAALCVQPFYILAYILGRRGRVTIAGYIPTTVVFAAMAGSFFQVGVGHISTIGLAMVVITAGILIGAGAATLFTVLGVVAYLIGGWAQLNGYVPTATIPADSIIIDAVGLGLGLLVLVIFNWLSWSGKKMTALWRLSKQLLTIPNHRRKS